MKEQLDSLERKLNETISFPDTYTFKFIYNLKEKEEKKAEIEALLTQNKLAILSYSEKLSSKGTYVSSSFDTKALNAKQIVNIYQASRELKGVTVL